MVLCNSSLNKDLTGSLTVLTICRLNVELLYNFRPHNFHCGKVTLTLPCGKLDKKKLLLSAVEHMSGGKWVRSI